MRIACALLVCLWSPGLLAATFPLVMGPLNPPTPGFKLIYDNTNGNVRVQVVGDEMMYFILSSNSGAFLPLQEMGTYCPDEPRPGLIVPCPSPTIDGILFGEAVADVTFTASKTWFAMSQRSQDWPVALRELNRARGINLLGMLSPGLTSEWLLGDLGAAGAYLDREGVNGCVPRFPGSSTCYGGEMPGRGLPQLYIVPEPSSLALLCLAGFGLILAGQRKST